MIIAWFPVLSQSLSVHKYFVTLVYGGYLCYLFVS
jgi:hypothetical protein